MHRRVLLAAIIIAAAALTACSSYDSDREQVALRYGNGFTEEKDYKGIIEPGTTNNVEFGQGAGDDIYAYPNTKRSWIAATDFVTDKNGKAARSKPAAADRHAYECVTNDDVRMLVGTNVFFTLNLQGTDTPDGRRADQDPPIRQFHENIGLFRRSWTADGWVDTLNVYFDQPIERVVDDVCGDYDSEALRSNNVTRANFARDITTAATDAIEASIGGRYFCGPADEGRSCGNMRFEVRRPELVNRDIVIAEERKREQAALLDAVDVENQRINKELESTRNEIDALGADNWVLLQAIKDGDITFMQLPLGGNVTVPAPDPDGK